MHHQSKFFIHIRNLPFAAALAKLTLETLGEQIFNLKVGNGEMPNWVKLSDNGQRRSPAAAEKSPVQASNELQVSAVCLFTLNLDSGQQTTVLTAETQR